MSNVEGAVLHRISSGVFRTGKKPPPEQRSKVPTPTLQHAIRSGTRSLGLALAVQAAISFGYSLVMTVRSLAGLRRALRAANLMAMFKTSFRFGLFVGAVNFAVQLMEYLFYVRYRHLIHLRVRSPHEEKTLKIRARQKNLVAAALCAGALMIENATRRHTISLFLFPRALDVLTLMGLKKKWIPFIPYTPTILFTAAQIIIMTCWAKFPQYLDPGYNRLIFKWCGDMTPKKLNDCLNQPAVLTPVGCKHCGFHQEESCLQYLFWYFMDRWQHNSLMYVPLYLVPRLVMRGKSLLTDAPAFMDGYLQNVLVSGLFLANYTVNVKAVICISRYFTTTNRLHMLTTLIAAGSAGPSILWERASRRIELLLYVSQRAGEALWRGLCDNGWAKDIPGHDALMFFITSFACLHAREFHRDCLRPSLKLVLTKVIGRSYLQQHDELMAATDESQKMAIDTLHNKAV